MFFSSKSQSNSSSRDAMTVAPCSCTAGNETNIEYFSGIAIAMSVLLCLVLSLINAISIIIGIIILNILLIYVKWMKEKAVCNLV